MNFRLMTAVVLAGLLGAAHAETPWEADQRQQLEKAQREGTLSPQIQMRLREEADWKAKHPGQPLPNPGQLQKIYRNDYLRQIDDSGARMRAQRQADLQREYRMVRANQQRQNDARHVTWTPAQWAQWDRQYDRAQQQKARDYEHAREIAGQIQEGERQHDEEQKIYRSQH